LAFPKQQFLTHNSKNVGNISLFLITCMVFCSCASPGYVDDIDRTDTGDGFSIRAWPLAVSSTDDNGNRTIWATPLFHCETGKEGLKSFHLLNYLQGEDYWALFPLAYSFGEPEKKHFGVAPLYFTGPSYDLIPPVLTYIHKNDSGEWTIWVTPLFHITAGDEENSSFHILNYFQGSDYKVLFPLAYQAGEDRYGIVPFFFKGADSWCAPPILSCAWTHKNGDHSLWITPLYHLKTSRYGQTWFHLLNYFQGPNYKLLFPLAYQTDEDHYGIIPLFFKGRDSWYAPLLLSCGWNRGDGIRGILITPLYHHSTDGSGDEWFHILNYFQGPDYKFLFPLAYIEGRDGVKKKYGIVPFFFKGDNSWYAPPLLSLGWEHGATEAAHFGSHLSSITRDSFGKETFHFLNYFQGPGYKTLFPLAYFLKEGDRNRFGILPILFKGKDSWCAPLLLSCGWNRNDGGKSLWITPFFHNTSDKDERQWFHFMNYFQGPNYKVLFPLAYITGEEENKRYGIAPIFFKGKESWCAPPILSGGWKHDGGESCLWITPLFHTFTDRSGYNSFHLLNYFQGPDYKVLFPLAYIEGEEEKRRYGIAPLFFKGRESWYAPPLLSCGWKRADGGSSLWLTPLFHLTRDGEDKKWFHFLNYFQGPSYKVLFPLAYDRGEHGFGIAPFFFKGKRSWCSPLLLSGGWKNNDNSRSLWITPFFHRTRDFKDRDSFHCMNYFQTPTSNVLFPIYWNWINREKDERTMIPPLYSSRIKQNGESSRSFLWPLSEFRKGCNLDKSLSVQLKPLVYQDAGEDYEFSFLWRIFHIRNEGENTSFTLGPLWWSEQRQENPSEYQFLGGLFARDCNYRKESYRYRILWFFPIGSDKPF